MEALCCELYTELLGVYPPILNVPAWISPVVVPVPVPVPGPRTAMKHGRIRASDKLNYLLLSFYVSHQQPTPRILWLLIDYRIDVPSNQMAVVGGL